MYRLTKLFYCCLLLTACSLLLTACSKDADNVNSLSQDKFIQAYFNHRENQGQTYIDPYRQIERSGDNLETIIIEEIATAHSSIDLAVYELNLPLVAQALARKHHDGVEVRVILDNDYSHPFAELNSAEIEQLNQHDRQKYEQLFQLVDLNQDHQLSSTEVAQQDALSILEQARVKVIDDTADGSKGSGLMHHKFMVIDHEKVIAGSTNYTLSDIHGDFNNPETQGNVNHLLRINNAQVANLFSEEFNYMWGNSNAGIESRFGVAKSWRSPQSFSWQDTQITIQFSPTSQQQNWSFSTNGLIGKTINDATKSIDLALFVFSEQELADILQRKHERGVEIKGIFDPGFAYRYYSEMLDMLGVSLYSHCLPEANNNPWLKHLDTVGTALVSSGDKLHHKVAIIDDKTVISGSQNWSEAANYQNDEAVIIITNSKVAQHFVQEFQRLYNSGLLGLSAKINSKLEQQRQKCGS
jgi:phosphatidylserine/phosphatidylglycerophosphate/cardiolipin synthase-like enzyme